MKCIGLTLGDGADGCLSPNSLLRFLDYFAKLLDFLGGTVAQLVERATPGEGPGFDPCCGLPLPTGWVSVSIM